MRKDPLEEMKTATEAARAILYTAGASQLADTLHGALGAFERERQKEQVVKPAWTNEIRIIIVPDDVPYVIRPANEAEAARAKHEYEKPSP